MKVKNATKDDLVVTPASQYGYPAFEVKAKGVSPDLPDDLAESLLDQPDNWQPVDSKAAAKDKE